MIPGRATRPARVPDPGGRRLLFRRREPILGMFGSAGNRFLPMAGEQEAGEPARSPASRPGFEEEGGSGMRPASGSEREWAPTGRPEGAEESLMHAAIATFLNSL